MGRIARKKTKSIMILFSNLLIYFIFFSLSPANAEAATISGKVYQGDGASTPIENVGVILSKAGNYHCADYNADVDIVITGADGSYLFNDVPQDHDYQISTFNTSNYVNEFYSSSGNVYDCAHAESFTVPSEGRTDMNLHLAPNSGATISGTLFENNGTTPVTFSNPMDSMLVILFSGSSGNEAVQGTYADPATGNYMFTNVSPGTYEITTSGRNRTNYTNKWWAPGASVPGGRRFLAEEVMVEGSETITERDFQLDEGGSISGTIYESNGTTPVSGLIMLAFSDKGGDSDVGDAQTDENGAYTLMGLPVGDIYINAAPWVDVPMNYVQEANYNTEWYTDDGNGTQDVDYADPVLVTAGDTASGIDLKVDHGGSVSGTVYDSDGTIPVSGITVRVFSGQCWGVFAGAAKTDENGHYTVHGVPHGKVNVRIYGKQDNESLAKDYVNVWYTEDGKGSIQCIMADNVTVNEGEDTSGIDFYLNEGGSISGTVYQSDGSTPIAGLTLIAIYEKRCFSPINSTAGITVTDRDGKYTIYGIPEGDAYVFTVASSGMIGDLNYVKDSNYIPEWYTTDGGSLDCNIADSVPVSQGSGANGIDFELDQGGSVSGTVHESDGTTPVSGVSVQAVHTECGSNVNVNAYSNKNGAYAIHGLPAGNVNIQAVPAFSNRNYFNEFYMASGDGTNDCNAASVVSVELGTNTPGINFKLDQSASVSGTIYESDGSTAIPGLQVLVFSSACPPWTFLSTWWSDQDGKYTIYGLPDDKVYLYTCSNCGDKKYLDELYTSEGGAPVSQCANAEPVLTVIGANTAGKDFQLEYLDTDGDGMPDFWETENGLNANSNDAAADLDDDGLTNLQEYQNRTNPALKDTDNDGMPDGWEVQYGLNPLVNDASLDPDKDGYANFQEYQQGGDPQSADAPFPWELFYPVFKGKG
jgi:hypothetical protein